MKTYYVRKSATTYAFALIIANSLEEAESIAIGAFDEHMSEETECYDIDHIAEIESEEAKEYDIPTLKQTKEGYEVIE